MSVLWAQLHAYKEQRCARVCVCVMERERARETEKEKGGLRNLGRETEQASENKATQLSKNNLFKPRK